MADITFYFSIYGNDFEPEKLLSIIKIAPTSVWKKGDKIYNTFRKETCLEYRISKENQLHIDNLIEEISKILLPCQEKLSVFIKENDLSAKLDVVITNMVEKLPSVCFNKDFLSLIHHLNGEIDIDMYLE